MAALFLAGAIFAQTGPSEVEKWVGPVLTSALSLAATYFAYLGGRDKLIYDADRKIVENENTHLKARVIEKVAELEAERLEHRATTVERDELRRKVDALTDRLNEDDESRRRRLPRTTRKPGPGTDVAKPLPPTPEDDQ